MRSAARLTGPPPAHNGPAHWIKVEAQGEPVRRYVIPIERAMDLVVRENSGGRR